MTILRGDELTAPSVHERRRCTLGFTWGSTPSAGTHRGQAPIFPGSYGTIGPAPAERGRRPLLSRRAGLTLALGGFTALAVAVVGLAATGGSKPPLPAPHADSSPAPAHAPGGIMIAGTENVEVHMLTYDPHQVTGWHAHTGLHAVAVLSGTLTVYGPDCEAHRYGAGESYVGGLTAHLARNETDEPVRMAVTYVLPAGTAMDGFNIPAPPPGGCALP